MGEDREGRRTVENEGERTAAAEVDDLPGGRREEGRVDFESGGYLVDLAGMESLAIFLYETNAMAE
jgi:hypothetical protein